MEILSEGFRYILQLHAFLPTSEIVFEPFVNLGFTALDKPKSTKVLFRNEGYVEGAIDLKYDDNLSPEITIEPVTF
jgi:hypothetical protein